MLLAPCSVSNPSEDLVAPMRSCFELIFSVTHAQNPCNRSGFLAKIVGSLPKLIIA